LATGLQTTQHQLASLHNGMHAMHDRGNNGSDAPSSTDMFGLIANFKMMAYFINEPSEL